jgi:hypothetical protein
VTPWRAEFTPGRLDGRTLGLLCETLTQLDVWELEEDPSVPLIYVSGVPYEPDRDALAGRPEQWRSVRWVIWDWHARHRGADCKRLAAWRCAEMRVRHGLPNARCVWTPSWDMQNGRVLYHVTVDPGDGSLAEDPSEILGMRAQVPAAVVGGLPWFRRS